MTEETMTKEHSARLVARGLDAFGIAPAAQAGLMEQMTAEDTAEIAGVVSRVGILVNRDTVQRVLNRMADRRAAAKAVSDQDVIEGPVAEDSGDLLPAADDNTADDAADDDRTDSAEDDAPDDPTEVAEEL